MDFDLTSGRPQSQRSGCVVVAVRGHDTLSPSAAALDEASGGAIRAALRHGDLADEAGAVLWLYGLQGVNAPRVLLVACGPDDQWNDAAYRKILQASAQALDRSGARSAVSFLPEVAPDGRDWRWRLRQAVLATEDALYRFERMKSESEPPENPLERLVFGVERAERDQAQAGLHEGRAMAMGQALAKDLGNLPANVCTPSYLAEQAEALAREYPSLSVTVLDEQAMERLGMGALLAVARGSEQPPRLFALRYSGADEQERPIALVGKGITFDTGGISIKPSQDMDEMKFDMCGAASVLGALKTCAELGLELNVVGVVAAAENMPSGRASRPGDVVTTLSGKTVEILNTDAEGRLVLCDALTWVQREHDPREVIDMATLTGACIIALGHHPSGLLANDDALAARVIEAGETAGDRVWRLPLWEDYQEQLKSNFADVANIGGRPAGTITAACFLWRFIDEDRPWAHLDIAGTAWKSGKEKGATGRPVPLLAQYLLDRART